MTEKEFRKLKALDLIQILLTQTNEVTAQQEELERKNQQMESLLSENEIIKAKLNDRDAMTELIKARLNDSDERIRELEKEVKSLYSDRIIELEDAGSLVQAALELNKIFEAAQREAEIYLYGAKRGIRGARYDTLGMSESFQEMKRPGVGDEQSLVREPAVKEQPLIKEPTAQKPLTDEKTKPDRISPDEEIMTSDRISPVDEKMMSDKILPDEEKMVSDRISPDEEEPSWGEMSPEEEPAAEAVTPDEEEPPGLEAFDWHVDEKKTEESAAAPTVETRAEQVEAEPAVEPPKKSEGSRLKGLFGFFKRKKR